jgi:hypothetical protein
MLFINFIPLSLYYFRGSGFLYYLFKQEKEQLDSTYARSAEVRQGARTVCRNNIVLPALILYVLQCNAELC